MSYELVIFDCDGTLVDSEPVTMRLIIQMMSEKGINLSFNEAMEIFAGKNMMAITSYMSGIIGSFDHGEFEEDYRSRCIDAFNAELKAVEGAETLITNLKIPYCIASNGPKRKMDLTLKVTGLIKYFEEEAIFSAYDIQKWKPEPDLYLHAASRMSVVAHKAIVIEDTLPGLMGAINAGIQAIAYNPEQKRDLYLDSVPNFSSMDDILDYLKTFGIV